VLIIVHFQNILFIFFSKAVDTSTSAAFVCLIGSTLQKFYVIICLFYEPLQLRFRINFVGGDLNGKVNKNFFEKTDVTMWLFCRYLVIIKVRKNEMSEKMQGEILKKERSRSTKKTNKGLWRHPLGEKIWIWVLGVFSGAAIAPFLFFSIFPILYARFQCSMIL
jgi:hypothetical protein